MGTMAQKRRKRKPRKKTQNVRRTRHVSRSRVISVLFWAFRIAVVCLFAFVAVWFFGRQVSMTGDSMKPVLNNGDVVLVNRFSYTFGSPKRGDLIVFKPKGNENNHDYIKRVVALPGETVELVEGGIYIDGEKLDESYETTPLTDVGIITDKITLEEDEYFVLGDDRQNSEDSRDMEVGNVKRSEIFGKAWFVLSPMSDFGFIK